MTTTFTKILGQVKWFGGDRNADRKKSYGFINIIQGELKDTDVFVHQSAVRPCYSTYRTLQKGEFVQLDVVTEQDGSKHADNVTGVLGYPLMCDMFFVTQKHIDETQSQNT